MTSAKRSMVQVRKAVPSEENFFYDCVSMYLTGTPVDLNLVYKMRERERERERER